MDIETLADSVLEYFTTENDRKVWSLKDNAPSWVSDMVYAAHDGMMPDDYKYRFIHDALTLIAAGDLDGDGIEPDIYTSSLYAWLASNLKRGAFVNDFVGEYGVDNKDFEIANVIAGGQLFERREVFYAVKATLADRIEQLLDNPELND